MKKIIEYLPLLSLCLIYFGFCNLYAYYEEFNVDIYVYITTPELIMAFFPTIVFMSSVVGTSFIQEFLGAPKIILQDRDNTVAESSSKMKKIIIEISRSFLTWLIVMIGINFTLRWILKRYFDYQPFDFQQLNIYSAIFFLIGIMFFFSYTGRKHVVRDNPSIFAFFIVCYIGINITNYRKVDAEKVKAGVQLRQISFNYKSKRITTGKQLVYIGQTTGHIFIYDRNGYNTIVYKASEIDSLVIKK